MDVTVRRAVPPREIFENALIERHTYPVFKKLKNASVAIAGAGGLGSNIAVSLARTGVGRLLIVDFDKVEISNLNRQQYFANHIGMYKTDALREILLGINPYINIETKTERVTGGSAAEIFSGFGIICEAFDNAEDKSMLIDSVLTSLPESIVIAASGMAGYLSANTIRTRKITNRLYICGDGVTDIADANGLMAPRVAVCANHQANMAVRLILGHAGC